MQIQPNEIDSVEEAGMLDGQPVRLARSRGGFWMAIGRRKGKGKEEILAAGSHPGIVKYNIEKQFPEFQPYMAKNENSIEPLVQSHSHYLPADLRKSGHDIYSVQSGNDIDFYITKQNIKLSQVKTSIVDGSMIIDTLPIQKEFSHAMAGAVTEKGLSCNASDIKLGVSDEIKKA